MVERAGKPIRRRARADADISEAIDHYLIESPAAALGFIGALEAAYRGIRRTPGIGASRYAHELNLPSLRFRKCRRHPYLIFYIEHADRIDLWRVLHAARDIPRWLADDRD